MANDKYELIQAESVRIGTKVLFRIKALKSLGRLVRKGDKGGYIESESNLSTSGNCWVFRTAKVYGDAKVSGDAQIMNDARVYDTAEVSGSSMVLDDSRVFEGAVISGNATISNSAKIYGKAHITDGASIFNRAEVYGNSLVLDKATVKEEAQVYGDSIIKDNAVIGGYSMVYSGLYKGNDTLSMGRSNNNSDDRKAVPATMTLKDKLSQGLKGVSKGDWDSRDYKEAKSDG